MFSNRDLARLLIPLVIEQFLAIFIGMADTIMVSGISESAVSAISLVDSINVLLIQLFSAMATGGAVVAAQYLGKGEPRNACKSAKQLVYVSLTLSLIIAAAGIAFCGPLLRLCFGGLSDATMRYCESYFYISLCSYPALALYNAGAALLRAMSNSKASMFTSFVMNILNVAGNALLIYVFRMEVTGAAIASLFARAVGACVMIRLLLHPAQKIHLENMRRPEFDWPMVKRILGQGIPNGMENSMFQVGKLLVTGIIAMFSESLIAANAVSNNIASFSNLIGCAVGLGMITVVGQCIGAGEKEQAKYYSMKLLKIIYACMITFNVFLFFFSREMASVFNLSTEGLDAAEELLRSFAVFASVFWPASFAIPNALRAAGDARFTMVVSILSMWIFRIGASYLFIFVFKSGLIGVWWAMYADWIARGSVFVWRYASGRWLSKKVV